MLNFTVGPVMSDPNILSLGSNQVPYFRTPEFSKLMLESESSFLDLVNAPSDARAVFITGSGTASLEAAVMNVLTCDDRALVVVGGSFGQRFSQLCDIHAIPHDDINVPFGSTLTEDMLAAYEGKGYTALLVNIHETSTGVLYDAELLSSFCKRNHLLYIVDAISAFLADPLDMHTLGIDVFITGSQKALACPPGVSIIALSGNAIERIAHCDPKCLYLDLRAALKDGERGQTPFTPAVGLLIQINKRLHDITSTGGCDGEVARVRSLALDFRSRINGLPLKRMSPAPSNAVTVLHPLNCSARDVFRVLKDQYGIWVCPNGGELADKVFRVGHIGCLTFEDNQTLVSALEDMYSRGLL